MSRVFRFHSEFDLDAAPDRVFEVLRDIDRWPLWWPQVRSVERIDDVSGQVAIRSVLPITLRLKLIALVEDSASGTLKASLDGDLTGWTQFVVSPAGGRTRLTYDQEAVVTKRGYGVLSRVGAPVLVLNHRLMMRTGMRALERRGAGTP